MKYTVLGVLAVVALVVDVQAQGKAVCYYGSFSDMPIERIDPFLCTHINYAFVGIRDGGEVVANNPGQDLPEGADGFGRLNALRNVNPGLRTLVAIGGGSEGSARFSAMAADPATRSIFIQNSVDFVRRYDFNGMDIDWEYPAQGEGSRPEDKDNFVLLLREMRQRFDENGLLLTAAVSAVKYSVDVSFGDYVPEISNLLDFINVMTYDFHGDWFQVTGQNAPLHASSIDTTPDQLVLNVVAGIGYWLERGASANKLILGIPTYGNTFTLANPDNNQLGAPTQPGVGGPNGGAYSYNQICVMLQQGGWTNTWDAEQLVPFMTRDVQWVGYDNMESVRYKTEFGLSRGFGGAMIWSLGSDDYDGICHGVTFPLLRTINEVLRNA